MKFAVAGTPWAQTGSQKPIHILCEGFQMKTLSVLLMILTTGAVFAADVPTVVVPTVAERISNARGAIKTQNWRAALAG